MLRLAAVVAGFLILGSGIALADGEGEVPQEAPEAVHTMEAARPTPGPDRAGYLQAGSRYDGRYLDGFNSFVVFKPFGARDSRVRPFVTGSVQDDTRSAYTTTTTTVPKTTRRITVPVPLIYGDNYALAALGVQYADPYGFHAFLQAGSTSTIGSVPAVPAGNDIRGGYELDSGWGTALAPGTGYGSITVSGTYYSRYANEYFDGSIEAARNIGSGRRPFEILTRLDASVDGHARYESTSAELTFGLRAHPFGPAGPTLAVEETFSQYLNPLLVPAGVPKAYGSFRPSFTYSRPF